MTREFEEHSNSESSIKSQIVFTKTLRGFTAVVMLIRRVIDAMFIWRSGGILVTATALAGLIAVLIKSMYAFYLVPIFFLIGFLIELLLPDSRIVSVIAYRTKRDYEQYSIWTDRMVPLRTRKSELDNEYRNLHMYIRHVDSEIRRLESEHAISERSDIPFRENSRIDVRGARVFGRGLECCYAYSFSSYIELANLKGLSKYPVKVGMTTKSNPIDRIAEQVQGSSTALSEKPKVLLVFYCKNAASLEQKLHDELKTKGGKVQGSIGKEWFETNSDELIELFRESV